MSLFTRKRTNEREMDAKAHSKNLDVQVTRQSLLNLDEDDRLMLAAEIFGRACESRKSFGIEASRPNGDNVIIEVTYKEAK